MANHIGSPVTKSGQLVGMTRPDKTGEKLVFHAVGLDGKTIGTFPTEREARHAVIEAAG